MRSSLTRLRNPRQDWHSRPWKWKPDRASAQSSAQTRLSRSSPQRRKSRWNTGFRMARPGLEPGTPRFSGAGHQAIHTAGNACMQAGSVRSTSASRRSRIAFFASRFGYPDRSQYPIGAIQAASDSFLRQAVAAVCTVEPSRRCGTSTACSTSARRPTASSSSRASNGIDGAEFARALLATRVPRPARRPWLRRPGAQPAAQQARAAHLHPRDRHAAAPSRQRSTSKASSSAARS